MGWFTFALLTWVALWAFKYLRRLMKWWLVMASADSCASEIGAAVGCNRCLKCLTELEGVADDWAPAGEIGCQQLLGRGSYYFPWPWARPSYRGHLFWPMVLVWIYHQYWSILINASYEFDTPFSTQSSKCWAQIGYETLCVEFCTTSHL